MQLECETGVSRRRRRRLRLGIVTCSLVAVCGLSATSAVVVASAGTVNGVTVVRPSRTELRLFKHLYARYRAIPASDVGKVEGDFRYGAHVSQSNTDWAAVAFVPARHDSLKVSIGFQDGGNIGIFKRERTHQWRILGVGGEPWGCTTLVPRAVKRAWGVGCPPGG